MHTSPEDVAFMQEALALARTHLGRVWPHPAVGCVVVKENQVVGRGMTGQGGTPHAEIVALNEAGERAVGATVYVSLEPCCQRGRALSCTDMLIDADVARVIAALPDPNPAVNGTGFAQLRAAGLAVEVGVCEDEAAEVNAGYFHRLATGQPLVVPVEREALHMTDLFDGAVFFDALLTSLETWLEAAHTRREAGLCVVLDDAAIAPAALARVPLALRQQIWLVAPAHRRPGRLSALSSLLENIIEVPAGAGGAIDLPALLSVLGEKGLTRVAVEAHTPLAERLAVPGEV